MKVIVSLCLTSVVAAVGSGIYTPFGPQRITARKFKRIHFTSFSYYVTEHRVENRLPLCGSNCLSMQLVDMSIAAGTIGLPFKLRQKPSVPRLMNLSVGNIVQPG